MQPTQLSLLPDPAPAPSPDLIAQLPGPQVTAVITALAGLIAKAGQPEVAGNERHPQREQEVDPDPGGQVPPPPLHRLGLLQDVIDQLERQVLR